MNLKLNNIKAPTTDELKEVELMLYSFLSQAQAQITAVGRTTSNANDYTDFGVATKLINMQLASNQLIVQYLDKNAKEMKSATHNNEAKRYIAKILKKAAQHADVIQFNLWVG